MRSLSNLYKGQVNCVKGEFYTRIIDNNEIVEQKLSALAVGNGTLPVPPQMDTAPELQIDYVEQAKEEAAQVIAQATSQAEQVLSKAVQEAENLKEAARREATEQGYAQGMAQAQEKEDQMRQELEQLRAQQEAAYAERLERMEAELMEVVVEVFDKVLQTDLSRQQEILLHLIRSTVQNIKNSSQFRIRVSEMDYETVSGCREEILRKIGGEVTLDIIMDDSVSQGQCTIDTDEGLFDCGLDVQLTNLVRDLKALSCMDA